MKSIIYIALFFLQLSLHAQKLSSRILQNKIELETVQKHKIKSIAYQTTFNEHSNFEYEAFDSFGNLIHSRNSNMACCTMLEHHYDAGANILTTYHIYKNDTVYKDSFNYKNGLLQSKISIQFIEFNGAAFEKYSEPKVIQEEQFFYDKLNRLIRFEDQKIIEKYSYDKAGNLIEIVFDTHKKSSASEQIGNYFWSGVYNSNNQLLKEQRHIFPNLSTYTYAYKENGLIDFVDFIEKHPLKDLQMKKYYRFNQNGLLTHIVSKDALDAVVEEVLIEYTYH